MGVGHAHVGPPDRGSRELGPVAAAVTLIARLTEAGLCVRLLGGLAVAARCETAAAGALRRSYSDSDYVVSQASAVELQSVLVAAGYEPAERFNAMHGHIRQLYTAPDGGKVDVFVGEFRMCHALELESRLELDSITVPLADLLLTKLQVAELNEKDLTDTAALLVDHRLSRDEAGINVTRLQEITRADWGWFKTVTDNLEILFDRAHRIGLGVEDTRHLQDAVGELRARLVAAPKTLRWRTRAKLGARVPWREEPEEV